MRFPPSFPSVSKDLEQPVPSSYLLLFSPPYHRLPTALNPTMTTAIIHRSPWTSTQTHRSTLLFTITARPPPLSCTLPFLDPEAVHLKMEDIKQDIQDITSDCLVSAPIPDKNLFDATDDTINYIKEFIQPYHSYSESCTNQANLTSGIRAEARATTAVTATVFTPKEGIPTNPLSNPTEESYTFSPHIHMTSQGKIPPQLQILHQVTLPDFKPHTYQDIIKLNNIQKNLHKFLLPPQNILSQWKYPKLFLSTSIWAATRRSCLAYFFCNKLPLYQCKSLKITISDPIWQPNDVDYLSSTIYNK